MEEIMKKLIALLMAIFMVLSLCAVCAVADEEYVKIAVSHKDINNWGAYKAMIISTGKISGAYNGGEYYAGYSWYVYVIEKVDGVYTATKCLTDNDEIGETEAPAGGFLLCIGNNKNDQYETIKDTLVGYTFYDNDGILVYEDFGIDTDAGNTPYYLYAKAPAKEPAATIEMKDFFVSHYDDMSVEGAGVVLTETYTGGAWWIHVSFKPVEGKTGVYEVAEVCNGIAGGGNGTPLAIPEGGFVYAINSGNNWGDLVEQHTAAGTLEEQWWYSSYLADNEYYTTNFAKNPAVTASIEIAKNMTVGSQWVFQGIDLEGKTVPTTTPDKKWYQDGYVCTAKVGAYVEGAVIPGTGDDDEKPEMETITVDGDLTDTGWNAKGWTTVKPGEGGTWQGEPKEGVTDTISFQYQIRKDDTKLYIAAVYDGAAVKVAAGSTNANGTGTNFRFWINDGREEATKYTHFIDACLCEDGTTGYRFMMNNGVTADVSHSPAPGVSESLVAVVTEKDGKTYCELAIDLADLGIPEGKTAAIIACVSNTPTGSVNDNLCLFAGEIPYGDATADKEIGGVLKNFPYNSFYFDVAVEITEDMDLGEITKPQPDTGDNGIVALAILAIVALFGSAIVVKSRH